MSEGLALEASIRAQAESSRRSAATESANGTSSSRRDGPVSGTAPGAGASSSDPSGAGRWMGALEGRFHPCRKFRGKIDTAKIEGQAQAGEIAVTLLEALPELFACCHAPKRSKAPGRTKPFCRQGCCG